MTNDGNEQAPLGFRCDAHVEVASQHDLGSVAVKRGVEGPELLRHVHERPDDDRKGGEARAGVPFQLPSKRLEGGGVHRQERGDVGDLLGRPRHLLGGQPANATHRDPLIAGGVGHLPPEDRSDARRSFHHVLSRHPAPRSGAGDRTEVDAELPG